MSILVSPEQLNDNIHHGKRMTLLASLWAPGEGESYNQFTSLHIPTAQYADAGAAFVGLPGSRVGRNPLPDPEKLQSWFETWGISENRPVIVYDEGRGLFAGRAWWTLRWAGVKNVHILDGGLANWRAKKLRTLTGPGAIAMSNDIDVNPGQMEVATIDDVRSHDGLLIDTRTASRFAGRREHLDLKAGHIPGAINLPERLFHDDNDRTWKSPEEIRKVLDNAGLNEDNLKDAIIYSGSGNHSALTLAVLEYIGITGLRHYVGGWSQWSADPFNPVERGDRLHVND
ncbi:Rhodanese-related sulfurtransferase [Corynebacterium camporealensis]|uniref:Rhodanese-related sulfurtransferase n=1 Tax=Corynebacterium camporealensis TaxID=161896 RepID=A0A0F6QZR9_9CORY|nr:sulfurtransferase [Corynebacterium camporealensis]AKE40008.1 rhodanese-related sulfurtransferase [Corynebacterium camporealensis]AVH89096.1 Rhodanese-related sulfurtransferase [Corynebacterium camporealensis]